ncbi:hypothetical protein HPB49_001383 [Dermacentor silvarum]|uniref:Uncharacterized protein n=1 Tax=Dermacentor silvarum TaxID=543639 RepID=A0ACB8D9Q3_DERSI|nr:hypothetical protein HPB49_001383 [Dermacentor silvarum]
MRREARAIIAHRWTWEPKRGSFRQQLNTWWQSVPEGSRVAYGLIAANAVVFLLWRVPRLEPIMLRYFVSHPASTTRSRTNCSIGSSWTLKVDGVTDPLTTDREPVSLQSPPPCKRLAATVVAAPFILAPAAWPADPAVSCPIRLEFGTATTTKATTPIYQRALVPADVPVDIQSPLVVPPGSQHGGAEQLRSYSRVVSSLASYLHKVATQRAAMSLGASGAILAVVGALCLQYPDAQLSILFLPFFTFSAAAALKGVLVFDTAGMLLRWRLLDHAAHLGGTLFGV